MSFHSLILGLTAWFAVSVVFGLFLGHILRKLDTPPEPKAAESSLRADDQHVTIEP